MEKNEYKIGEANTPRRGPGPHHGPGGPGGGEKAKDLLGTWKKLFGYCRKYLPVITVALVCAVAGTVLTLIGPDKLSEMTDTITAGIAPKTELLSEITETVSANISANMEMTVNSITQNIGDTEKLNRNSEAVMASPDISDADKAALAETLEAMSTASPEESQLMLLSLPDSVDRKSVV